MTTSYIMIQICHNHSWRLRPELIIRSEILSLKVDMKPPTNVSARRSQQAFLSVLIILVLGLILGPGQVVGAEDVDGKFEQTGIHEPDEVGGLDLIQLSNIRIVTATKRTSSLRKAPAIATVITAQEIRNMGARTLMDVLKMVPGFGISIIENGTHPIEVRGIRTPNSEKILVMIDGHATNMNIFGSGFYVFADMLSVENIKQVEVIRGPGSALYGTSAFLATINVITREADEIDGVETKVGVGSFDTVKGNLAAGKRSNDKLAISTSIDYYKTDGADVVVESDRLSGTPYSLAPASPDLKVEQADAFLKVLYGDLAFRGHFITTRKGMFIPAFAVIDESYYEADYYWGELAWNREITQNLSTLIKLYYDHYEQDPFYKIMPNGFNDSFPDGMTLIWRVKNRTYGGELQFEWKAFEGNYLIAGVAYNDFEQYGIEALANYDTSGAYIGGFQESPKFNRSTSRQTWAVFLQDEWQALEQFNLTAGIRYDHYSDFGNTINPRAGLVWNLEDNVDLKLLYGRAFRAPLFTELYATRANPYAIGNPDLDPERITTWEAGVTYRPVPYIDADLNYFYSKVKDQIGRVGAEPAQYANVVSSVTKGVELGLNGYGMNNLQWKLAYTYQDPRNDLTGKRLPYVPSHRGSVSLNYGLTRNLNLHTDVLWTGSRPRSEGESRSEMPSFTTVDLALTVRRCWQRLECQLAVHNLLDKQYADPDTSSVLNYAPDDFPREGRSVLGSVLYRF